MKVKLVAKTMPEHDVPCDGIEELLYYFARVSNTANQINHSTGPKLIKGLVERLEWSPLEMVNLVFEVETERDITHQVIRHKMSFQEYSQRWSEAPIDYDLRRPARMQNPRDRSTDLPCEDPQLLRWWDNQQGAVLDFTRRIYKEALEKGLSKTLSRSVLPEGLTPTRIYINGNLRSWLHYIAARTAHAQHEHMLVAEEVRSIIKWRFPSALKWVKF